ncbi:MAG: fimbria/pilus periplasmic chaperone [Alphaproteobacteria bacterium]|nr:fimbria/pilus periplasmic chaperone [Alphaproteobacteria bacterium]
MIRLLRGAAAAFAAAFAVLTLGAPAEAIRVEPMVHDLEPSGQGATMTVNVQNTDDAPLTYEVQVFRREIGVNGEDVQTPADSDFQVFPPQGVVRPGGAQALRVRYVGPSGIDQSRNYVVMVTQLPVALTGEEQVGLRFVFSFGVSVSVIPRGARPDLQTTSIAPGRDGLEVRIRNAGAAVTRLAEWEWRFRAPNGAEHRLSGDALREQIAQPLILPGTDRIVSIRVPPEFTRGGVTLSFHRPAS